MEGDSESRRRQADGLINCASSVITTGYQNVVSLVAGVAA